MRLALPWVLLCLAACQTTPLADTIPTVALTPVETPRPAGTRAAPPSPALPGQALVAGQTITLQFYPGDGGRVLVANVSDADGELHAELAPPAHPEASPTAATPATPEPVRSKGPAPSEEPAPSRAPSPAASAASNHDPSPAPSPAPSASAPLTFGFGFGDSWSRSQSRSDAVLTRGRRTLSTPSKPLKAGARQSFWINNGDAQLTGDALCPSRLRVVTDHAYFFVDDSDADALADTDVQRLADAFERQIRPALTPVFGTEPVPGIDGDPHLFVVCSSRVGSLPDRQGLMGYFWGRDVQPSSDNDVHQHSNEHEMLFLAGGLFELPEVTALGALAHEYQHLLTFVARENEGAPRKLEDTWLDEGMSMLAMDLAGGGLQAGDPYVVQEVADFEADPAAYSLTRWSSNPRGSSYGQSYLFLRYLIDRFGTGVLKEIQASPETGVTALDAILAKNGSGFGPFFIEWASALAPTPRRKEVAFTWFNPEGTYGDRALAGITPQPMDQSLALTLPPWSTAYLSVPAQDRRLRTLSLSAETCPLVVLEGTDRLVSWPVP